MRVVSAEQLRVDADEILRHLTEVGPVIVTEAGEPKAVMIGITEDDLEDYALASSEAWQRELTQAYGECLNGLGRPAEDLLRELAD